MLGKRRNGRESNVGGSENESERGWKKCKRKEESRKMKLLTTRWGWGKKSESREKNESYRKRKCRDEKRL